MTIYILRTALAVSPETAFVVLATGENDMGFTIAHRIGGPASGNSNCVALRSIGELALSARLTTLIGPSQSRYISEGLQR
jgi:hypothetical protein